MRVPERISRDWIDSLSNEDIVTIEAQLHGKFATLEKRERKARGELLELRAEVLGDHHARHAEERAEERVAPRLLVHRGRIEHGKIRARHVIGYEIALLAPDLPGIELPFADEREAQELALIRIVYVEPLPQPRGITLGMPRLPQLVNSLRLEHVEGGDGIRIALHRGGFSAKIWPASTGCG